MLHKADPLQRQGQRQRVSIARAVIANPSVLLLDEATSALDTTSEVLVQQALDRVSEGRTTISIAHRLSTIKDAHQIVVMSGGKIIERGTHNELLVKPDGMYAGLVEAQTLKQREYNEDDVQEKTSRQIDDLNDREAKDAKEMGQLKRTGTGRSETSRVLAERGDTENETRKKEHGILYLLYRLISSVWELKWYYYIGTAMSILVGCTYPVG